LRLASTSASASSQLRSRPIAERAQALEGALAAELDHAKHRFDRHEACNLRRSRRRRGRAATSATAASIAVISSEPMRICAA
jgi:hypothetical protein